MKREGISGWGRNFLHGRMVRFIGQLEKFAPDEKPGPEGRPTLWELFPTIASWDIPGLTLEVEEEAQGEGKILHYYSIEKVRMLSIVVQKHDSQSDNYLRPFFSRAGRGYKLRPRTDMRVGLYLLLSNWLNFCAKQLAAMAEAEERTQSSACEAQQAQRLMRRVLVGKKASCRVRPYGDRQLLLLPIRWGLRLRLLLPRELKPQIAQRVGEAVEHIMHGVGKLNAIYRLDSQSRERKKGGYKLHKFETVSELRDAHTSRLVYRGRCHIATIISNSSVEDDSSPPSLLDIAQWDIKGIRLEKREQEEFVSGYWGEAPSAKNSEGRVRLQERIAQGYLAHIRLGGEGRGACSSHRLPPRTLHPIVGRAIP